MKFMKLGTRQDTFYTEKATRSLVSDIPPDLVIKINDNTYLLHKSPILPKSGLLQRLCSDSSDSEIVPLELHDMPGGADAFELSAKFCYGISINISAHNLVPALCAAKLLQMNDSIEKGNFVGKLEAFFSSCILEGWKDSIVTLQTTDKLPEWSEKLGIIRKCIDSIIEKVLTPPPQVKWSYTYTRPGYARKQHHSVPKDWWTEDVSDLDIDLFRCIIMAIRATYVLPPQLIGEALHVYACKWLPGITKLKSSGSSVSQTEESKEKNRKILETIVSMIPADRGSVSAGFLLRLLSISSHLGVSPVTRTELIKRASIQLEEATVSELLYTSTSSLDQNFYDIELVLAVLESFLKFWKRISPGAVDNRHFLRSIRNVGKLIDSYLQVVARDDNLPVSKFVTLAETVPAIGRLEHDDLYQAISIYLKVHPDLSKADKKRLCGILECQRLSPEVRAHAVKNEFLPLRTVVQLLYFEQEKGSKATTSPKLQKRHELLLGAKKRPATRDSHGKQSLGLDKEEFKREQVTRRTSRSHAESREKNQHKTKLSDSKLALDLERKVVIRGDTEKIGSEKVSRIKEESMSVSKLDLDPKKIIRRARSNKSEHGHEKGR
ncbi:BTB/POZ domain-containing protein At5g47800-like isoform X2 [Gastrolobium bilobum]|uniref:BTB/POZ domain-containing protein At5g47800-like isoform X2 n=1 Tax=Gastrolobium bilobum TaxID=150636 RepID=UPI002AB0E4F6|nr:BTB/POZ domain-containing protein At5g47800-like isoform X2 [Gastrolobium bilobum]